MPRDWAGATTSDATWRQSLWRGPKSCDVVFFVLLRLNIVFSFLSVMDGPDKPSILLSAAFQRPPQRPRSITAVAKCRLVLCGRSRGTWGPSTAALDPDSLLREPPGGRRSCWVMIGIRRPRWTVSRHTTGVRISPRARGSRCSPHRFGRRRFPDQLRSAGHPGRGGVADPGWR